MFLRRHLGQAKKIEEQISKFSYSGEKRIKDQRIENAKLPSVAAIFYSHIFHNVKIPDEEQLCRTYLKFYFNKQDNGYVLKNGSREIYSEDGIVCRVLRTYPSLIRDFHFYWMCHESGLFDRVLYSLSDDFSRGARYTGDS